MDIEILIHSFNKINCGQIVDKKIVDKMNVEIVDKNVYIFILSRMIVESICLINKDIYDVIHKSTKHFLTPINIVNIYVVYDKLSTVLKSRTPFNINNSFFKIKTKLLCKLRYNKKQ